MIVTCPSCSSRYKIKADKITGRGAKITCPKCSHRFVVYNEDSEASTRRSVPDTIADHDFKTLGLTWRVRRTDGQTLDFGSLGELTSLLEDQQVTPESSITFDNRDWSEIKSIEDMELFFFQTWEKAKRGEIIIAAPDAQEEEEEDEDAADAPTTLFGQGSNFSGELADLIAGLETPAAPLNRQESPEAVVVDQTGEPADPREVSNLSANYVEPSDLATADRPAPLDTGAPAQPRTYAPPEPANPDNRQPAPEASGISMTRFFGLIIGLTLIIAAFSMLLFEGNPWSHQADQPSASAPSAQPVEQPAEQPADAGTAPEKEQLEAPPPEPPAPSPSGGG